MSRRAVVFDLDGTLIDSRGDIAESANHMLVEAGRERLSEGVISSFVGDGARLLVARSLGLEVDSPEVGPHLEVFLRYYEAHPVVRTKVYPGVQELFSTLASLPLALCTNKPRRTTDPVLRALGWQDSFRVVVAGGDTKEKKPHPEPLERIARELGLRPDELVMVGDGPQDIGAGRAVGALTVGVRGGILEEARLLASEPDVLLDSLEQLPAALRARGVEF